MSILNFIGPLQVAASVVRGWQCRGMEKRAELRPVPEVPGPALPPAVDWAPTVIATAGG